MSIPSDVDLSSRAQDHLRSLIYGIDPRTGAALTDISALSDVAVLRSLLLALEVLEQRSGLLQDTKVGKRTGALWTHKEDEELLKEFRAGVPLQNMAVALGRSKGGIIAHLVKLEVFASRDEARAYFKR